LRYFLSLLRRPFSSTFCVRSMHTTLTVLISAARRAGPHAAESRRQPAVLSGRAQLPRGAAGAAPTVDDVQHCAELAGARALNLDLVLVVFSVGRVCLGIRAIRVDIGANVLTIAAITAAASVVIVVAIGSKCGRVGRGRGGHERVFIGNKSDRRRQVVGRMCVFVCFFDCFSHFFYSASFLCERLVGAY
jgi:hypothetical protein